VLETADLNLPSFCSLVSIVIRHHHSQKLPSSHDDIQQRSLIKKISQKPITQTSFPPSTRDVLHDDSRVDVPKRRRHATHARLILLPPSLAPSRGLSEGVAKNPNFLAHREMVPKELFPKTTSSVPTRFHWVPKKVPTDSFPKCAQVWNWDRTHGIYAYPGMYPASCLAPAIGLHGWNSRFRIDDETLPPNINPHPEKKKKVQQVLDDCPDEKTPASSALTEQN
jgi:hypothetical protein